MMLPGHCERCGAPVELRMGENPPYYPHLANERVRWAWWEDRGTGVPHRCAS